MTLRSTNEFNFAGGKEDGNCVATFGVCCVIGYVVSNFYNNLQFASTLPMYVLYKRHLFDKTEMCRQ